MEPLAPAFSVISFDLENTPKLERKADPPKPKKERTASAAPTPKESTPAPETKPSSEGKVVPEGVKTQKKEKKEKKGGNEGGKGKGGEKGGNAAAAAEGSGEPVPSMIDLRVGHILDSELFRFPCVFFSGAD